jgi:5-methylcytosine-specific restriction protein B
VSKPGWGRTVIRLDLSEFDEIASSPPIGQIPLPHPEPPGLQPTFSIETCADETNIDVATLRQWLAALERKRQAIIYGPPGTGKTFVAERLARHLVAETDGFVQLVQFHPTYAYEDFVQGIRPEVGAEGSLQFNMRPGRFLSFCERARSTTGPAVLVIDEINRANLSKVFGELMYLLEYRDRHVPLAGDGTLFDIPANIRVIGTMNTADRSIALVDHALRRRFAFIPLQPDYDILRRYHESAGTDVDPLIQVLQELNGDIGDRNFEIGVSFFMVGDLLDELESIWRMEIEPYLEEVFFDRQDKRDDYRWERIVTKVLPSDA